MTNTFSIMLKNAPFKLSVSDVLKCRKSDSQEYCTLKLNAEHGRVKVLQLNSVWIQGHVVKGFEKSEKISLAIKDETGSIRVSYVGNLEMPWINTGVYCSAVGSISFSDGVPEVVAVKMTDLSRNQIFQQIWPYEVKELKLLSLGLLEPTLKPFEGDDW